MIRNYGLRIRESIGVKDTQINLDRPEIGYCLIIDCFPDGQGILNYLELFRVRF